MRAEGGKARSGSERGGGSGVAAESSTAASRTDGIPPALPYLWGAPLLPRLRQAAGAGSGCLLRAAGDPGTYAETLQERDAGPQRSCKSIS